MRRPLRRAIWMAGSAVLLCAAVPLSAQRSDSLATRIADTTDARLACAAYGVTSRAWSGAPDAVPAPPPGPATVRPDRADSALDTTIRLAISDRTWQRDDVNAGVALGAAGTAGRQSLPWSACAGASVHLGSVTAYLHNVSGLIHIRADLGALRPLQRAPGSTPPAVPPRR
jgi:hypothetical protein